MEEKTKVKHTPPTFIFREIRPQQITNEHNRIVKKYLARVSRRSPFVFVAKNDTPLSLHNAKLAAVVYHLRYVERMSPRGIQCRLALSDMRLREIICEYTWYPGMMRCG